MIKKILRYIRQKPKAVREQYAFWIACSVTGVIALVWVSQFFATEPLPPNSLPIDVVSTPTAPASDVVKQQSAPLVSSEAVTDESLVSTSTSQMNSQPAQDFEIITTAQQEVRIATTSSNEL